MKGHTFSLSLLLLVSYVYGEPAKVDYLPLEASVLLLPTNLGTFDKASLKNEFGHFREAYTKCGQSGDIVPSSVGLAYPGASHFYTELDCHPDPMRVVYAIDDTPADLTADGKEVDLKTCQGLQTCGTKTNLDGTVSHGETAVADGVANGLTAINSNDREEICKGDTSKKILFSNEMSCTNPTEVPAAKGQKNGYVIAPRWKTDEYGFYNVIRPFFWSGIGRRPELKEIPRTNNFLKLKPGVFDDKNKFHSCWGTCDRGSVIKMKMRDPTPDSNGWRTRIHLKGKSNGFKVCVGAQQQGEMDQFPQCRSRFELFVLPKNNLVIWPKSGRASVIELKGKSVSGDTDGYAIELGFGYQKPGGQKGDPEFYVANMYREVVTSDGGGWESKDATHVTFFFENGDDLLANGGIHSGQIESAYTYSDDGDNVKSFEPTKEKGIAVAEGTEKLFNTYDETPEALIMTTTPASPRLGSNINAGVLLPSTDNSNDAIYMPGKWWAWGLYIGFIVGAIAGVGIIGGIFYVLRRTVYGFWYRGMYKRYGCDASGTTGGITGVGFGNTTTGAITVGGTTGGGTTGKTGMTTGGTTKTSGGTTGSMTSTGGASTIAM